MFFIENSLPLTSELRGPNRLGFVGAGANTNGQAAFIPLHADQSGAVGKVGKYYGGSVMKLWLRNQWYFISKNLPFWSFWCPRAQGEDNKTSWEKPELHLCALSHHCLRTTKESIVGVEVPNMWVDELPISGIGWWLAEPKWDGRKNCFTSHPHTEDGLNRFITSIPFNSWPLKDIYVCIYNYIIYIYIYIPSGYLT